MQLSICPKCGSVTPYNSYFGKVLCSKCDFEATADSLIKDEICNTLNEIEDLADKDITEYVNQAPEYKGKKVLSPKAHEVLWDKLLGQYIGNCLTTKETSDFAKGIMDFAKKYICVNDI